MNERLIIPNPYVDPEALREGAVDGAPLKTTFSDGTLYVADPGTYEGYPGSAAPLHVVIERDGTEIAPTPLRTANTGPVAVFVLEHADLNS